MNVGIEESALPRYGGCELRKDMEVEKSWTREEEREKLGAKTKSA